MKRVHVILFALLIASGCAAKAPQDLTALERQRAEAFLKTGLEPVALQGFARIRIAEKERSVGLGANIAILKPDHLYAEVLKSLQPIFILSIRGEKMSLLDPSAGILYEGMTSEELGRFIPYWLELETFLNLLMGSWSQEELKIDKASRYGDDIVVGGAGYWEKAEMKASQTGDIVELRLIRGEKEVRMKNIHTDQKLARRVQFREGRSLFEVRWQDQVVFEKMKQESFLPPKGSWIRKPIHLLDRLPGF